MAGSDGKYVNLRGWLSVRTALLGSSEAEISPVIREVHSNREWVTNTWITPGSYSMEWVQLHVVPRPTESCDLLLPSK